MVENVSIRIHGFEHGKWPQVLPLNPSLRADTPLLKLTVEVHWAPADAVAVLEALEGALASESPSFKHHQCRAPHDYLVFDHDRPQGGTSRNGFEPPLALVHLVEHVIIDVVAFVSDEPSVSGLTGARSDAPGLYDVFVECPDPALARFAAHFALTWVASLLEGETRRPAGRLPLDLARFLYGRPEARVPLDLVARELHRDADDLAAALEPLELAGLARAQRRDVDAEGFPYVDLPGRG